MRVFGVSGLRFAVVSSGFGASISVGLLLHSTYSCELSA